MAAYRGLIRRWPMDPSVHSDLGNVLAHTGDLAGAIAEYNEVIRLNVRLSPNDGEAHANLAKILATGPDGVRDGKKAVEYASRACELSLWKEPRYIGILATAYAGPGTSPRRLSTRRRP